jgi:hypothetical protein
MVYAGMFQRLKYQSLKPLAYYNLPTIASHVPSARWVLFYGTLSVRQRSRPHFALYANSFSLELKD